MTTQASDSRPLPTYIRAIDITYKFTTYLGKFFMPERFAKFIEFKDGEDITQKLGIITGAFTVGGLAAYTILKSLGLVANPSANKVEITGDNAGSLDEICDNICEDRVAIHQLYWQKDVADLQKKLDESTLLITSLKSDLATSQESLSTCHNTLPTTMQECFATLQTCIMSVNGDNNAVPDHQDL